MRTVETPFASAVSSLAESAAQLDELAPRTGLSLASASAITDRLARSPFRVLVLGEFSRGKSTFINALLRQKVLPASVRPTTAVICAIRSGPAPKATIHWRDGSRPSETVQLPVESIDKALTVLTAKNGQAPDIARVEIEFPIPAFDLPLEIIDFLLDFPIGPYRAL